MKNVVTIWLTALYLIIVPSWSIGVAAQEGNEFQGLWKVIETKDFFTADSLYQRYGKELSANEKLIVGSILANAFHKLEGSQASVAKLLDRKEFLPDSLALRMLELRYDNALKQFHYAVAAEAIVQILKEYPSHLTDKEIDDYKNTKKICSALQNIPEQKIIITQDEELSLEKDLAGLQNLDVRSNGMSKRFIFDTGANISVITESLSRELGMQILPGEIEVTAITGKKVPSKLAVCKELWLGTIKVSNVVFLVLEDSELTFPQIDYKINGILGFPVISALGELQFTAEGRLKIPWQQGYKSKVRNMAIDGLVPLIWLDGKHFSFDTGAAQTMLYSNYYDENREFIDGRYELQKLQLGGAGGSKSLDGFQIQKKFHAFGREINLENVMLISKKIKERETVYGNIGRDFIEQFEAMTIDFNHMSIIME